MAENVIAILTAGGIMLAVAVVFGTVLTVCSHVFSVKKDERAEQVENLLAKSNCGGCGYAGCAQFAEALVKGDARISVASLKTKYPQGAERSLIYATTGRSINSSMLPADAGCIVDNVATIVAIKDAVKDGKPLFSRVVTVTGDAVANPGNFLVRTGTNVNELIEAARIDGSNEFQIFHKQILPLSKNGISAIAIFQFLWVWEDYLWPYLMIDSEAKQLLAVGLTTFNGRYTTDYGGLFAATSISILPVILVYVIFQRRFVAGVASGAVKG